MCKINKIKQNIIFKSRPVYFSIITIIGLAIMYITIIGYDIVNKFYILSFFLIIFIVAFTTVQVFVFSNLYFYKIYPLRPSFLWKIKKYSYSDLFIIEIKKLTYPKHIPCVIVHFSKKRHLFASNRTFWFKKNEKLTPLIELLVEKNVNFIIKTSRGKDRIFFKRIIEATKERTSSSTKVKYVKYE